jgi:hypothetical protein
MTMMCYALRIKTKPIKEIRYEYRRHKKRDEGNMQGWKTSVYPLQHSVSTEINPPPQHRAK